MEASIQPRRKVKSREFTKGGSLSQKPSATRSEALSHPRLTPFQQESVELFVQTFGALSLPSSVAKIYGLLFSSPHPLSLDEIVERLALSRGSVSEGLRWLKSTGAAKLVSVPNSRREHFTAETSLRKLAGGYLRDRIDPHLENGSIRLRTLESRVNESSPDASFERSRVNQLAGWYRFLGKALPLIKALSGRF